MDLQEMKTKLVKWIGQMKFGYREPNLYMYKEESRIRILFFTRANRYSIVASFVGRGEPYLGAQVSSRKPRAGEDWTRGNDLADGLFSEGTWNRILGDIVGSELVDIQRPVRLLLGDGGTETRKSEMVGREPEDDEPGDGEEAEENADLDNQ